MRTIKIVAVTDRGVTDKSADGSKVCKHKQPRRKSVDTQEQLLLDVVLLLDVSQPP